MQGISNKPALPLLKKEIEGIFGKKIAASGDCIFLSNEILFKTHQAISSNTLRRLFGLVKTDFHPSSTTLHILVKYCGFSSLQELVKLRKAGPPAIDDNSYAESVLNYLLSLFTYTPVKECNDKDFMAFVKITLDFLKRHPELIDNFQKGIARSKNGREYYYEKAINIDDLNSFYGDGLRYYLVENKTTKAQVLGHSLLCLRNWLVENKAGVNHHYQEAVKHTLTKDNHPYLWVRYYAAQLMHAEVNHLPIDKIIEAAQQSHALLKQQELQDRCQFFPCFEYVLCPVLIIMGRANDALYFINFARKEYVNKIPDIDDGFYDTLELFEAMAAYQSGNIPLAEKLFSRLHPTRFHYLNKKSCTILYLFLCEGLNKQKESTQQQLNELIGETGFTRFKQIEQYKMTAIMGAMQEKRAV